MTTQTLKQHLFIWHGTDKRGAKVSGQSRGSNAALIKAELRRQGILPTKVKKKSDFLGKLSQKPIRAKDIAIFMRQLATMLAAGVPLVQSFDIIGRGHENPSMQKLVMAVKANVEGGSNLADSLAKHPAQFDDLVCNLVEAGEHAGVLETLLDKIAIYKEKTEELKSKIKKAMFYPVAVMIVAGIVTTILLLFVVPQFEELFANFGADLPAFTLFVVGLSRFMQEWWWALFGSLGVGFFVLYKAHKRSRKIQHLLDRLLLKVPVVGELLRKAAIARYARTLSTMFAAGVPLVEALQSVAGATGNIVFTNAIMEMREKVSTGQQLQLAMSQSGMFPNMVVQMVAIGEESGSLDAMLSKVADFYEQEVDDAVDGLSSLLEPLIMAILGVLIGGLIIAMYLPIFELGSVI